MVPVENFRRAKMKIESRTYGFLTITVTIGAINFASTKHF